MSVSLVDVLFVMLVVEMVDLDCFWCGWVYVR